MWRWINVVLGSIYIFFSVGLQIVLLVVCGGRLSNAFRWELLVGWAGVCLGKIWLAENLYRLMPGRLPVLAEEERLETAMREVSVRAGSTLRVRILIGKEPEQRDGSVGYHTIVVPSAALQWASEGELRAFLAHELGHIRDGDRALREVFHMTQPATTGFRLGRGLIRRLFRFWSPGAMVLTLFLLPLGFLLLPSFLWERSFGLLLTGLRRWDDFRQDAFAFRAGYGEGLRAWLERSGLG